MSNTLDFISLLGMSFTDRTAYKKICFQGAVYPLLFFTEYFAQLKKNGIALQVLNLEQHEFASVVAQLEMSLLGNSSTYWLKDLSALAAAAHKQYVSYLEKYQGPHQVYFFVQDQPPAGVTVVTIPESVDSVAYRALAQFFGQDASAIEPFVKTVFMHHKLLPLEKALLLIQYQLCIGRRFQSFIATWLPRIVVSEQSLFTLSQLFFERNYAHCIREWSIVKNYYPDEFWVVFWSEQLWQALIFIEHVQRGQRAQVRQKVYRLPFSFMNKDWKFYSEKELTRAHQFLYAIDFGLKNGYATDGIDLFVHSFLLKRI